MTPAIEYLKKHHIDFEILTYECHVTDDFGHHCAEQLNLDPNQVFKTLLIQHEKKSVTAIIPVNTRLNLKLAAKAASLKNVEMMKPADAERQTGYKVGGISPFGQKKLVPTLLELSALQYEKIIVSGGKRGVSISIKPQVLAESLQVITAQISE